LLAEGACGTDDDWESWATAPATNIATMASAAKNLEGEFRQGNDIRVLRELRPVSKLQKKRQKFLGS
jgi:hypothetical protein